MSIIIISSNSPIAEKEIAEKIIKAKGYKGVNTSILSDIESKYHIESGKLSETLENTPSFFGKMVSKKWHYRMACIEAEILDRLTEDNAVCWGLAAHLYVVGVSHALKVRIIHENRQHIEKIAEHQGIAIRNAEKWLETENMKRKKWSLASYNRDETDPSEYDLVLNLDETDPAEAVEMITCATNQRKFQSLTYSHTCLSDLVLAARVKAKLLKSMNDIRVQANNGTIRVFTKVFKQKKIEKIKKIKELAGNIVGVNYVEVHVTKNLFGEPAENNADFEKTEYDLV